MPQRCSMPGCKVTYKNALQVSFHTFPKDKEVRKHWQRICASKICENQGLDNLRVCSLHFPPEAYENLCARQKRLKKEAVPTLNISSPGPARKKSKPTQKAVPFKSLLLHQNRPLLKNKWKKPPKKRALPVEYYVTEEVCKDEVDVKEETEVLGLESPHDSLIFEPITITPTNTTSDSSVFEPITITTATNISDSIVFESGNEPWRIMEHTDTVPGAGVTSSAVSVNNFNVSSRSETMNVNMEEEEGDGDDLWDKVTSADVPTQPPPFLGTPGPRNLPHLQNPVDFVRLFITPTFLLKVARETNRFASHWIKTHKHSQEPLTQSTIHSWQNLGKTTSREICVFLAVTLNMSLIKKPSVASYWDDRNSSQATPWFGKHLTLERYNLLMKFLSFYDCNTVPDKSDPSHKLHEIQPLITHFCHVFRHYYKPHHNIMLGESMTYCGNNRPDAWRCLPSKPLDKMELKTLYPLDEFGVKIWYLCDVQTEYAFTFQIEKKMPNEETNDENEVYDLVMHLMEAGDVLHQGYHLYVGKCPVFPQLFFDLWKCQTLGVGMMLSYRGIPAYLSKGKFKSWHSCKQKKGPLFCIAFNSCDKREVLLSTVSGADLVCPPRGSKYSGKPQPRIIEFHKRATDTASFQTLAMQTHIPGWNSIKWSTRVAMTVINTAFQNAYILYTTITKDKQVLSQYSFMVSAIEGLAEGHIPHKSSL